MILCQASSGERSPRTVNSYINDSFDLQSDSSGV